MKYWDIVGNHQEITRTDKITQFDVPFRTVSRGSRVPRRGSQVPEGQFSEGSEKVRRRSEKVRESMNKLEKVREN